jgi:hypothetical protein
MATKKLKRRHGIVVILDALGASAYSDEKIEIFLSARSKLNKILNEQASDMYDLSGLETPTTYTFGDTLIVVQELSDKENIGTHILAFSMLLQNYLYHSLEEGILFRGAFSIGSYLEDESSNTVMGQAISDAASWYEKSDWMGLTSTPKTNNVLEFHFDNDELNDPEFICYYPVPMKDGGKTDLYTVSWAGRFFHDENEVPKPREKFIGILKELPVPLGTESKFSNTKEYFSFIEAKIKSNE